MVGWLWKGCSPPTGQSFSKPDVKMNGFHGIWDSIDRLQNDVTGRTIWRCGPGRRLPPLGLGQHHFLCPPLFPRPTPLPPIRSQRWKKNSAHTCTHTKLPRSSLRLTELLTRIWCSSTLILNTMLPTVPHHTHHVIQILMLSIHVFTLIMHNFSSSKQPFHLQ